VRPGRIVDHEGRVVGAHEGIHRFTVGQRKGLGVTLGAPAFVARIDSETGDVHLGPEEALEARSCEIEDLVLAEGVTLPRRARVRLRYRHEGVLAEVRAASRSRARASFDAPARAVTPGQIAVFYDADRVLGGGRVTAPARGC
jgi:tRNA-specific 2-thiouridylase